MTKRKTGKKLTPEQYVSFRGRKCPECESMKLTQGLNNWIGCDDCKYSWEEEYRVRIVGYKNLTNNK